MLTKVKPSFQLKDPSLLRQQCYIDGKWVDADDGKTLAVHNPADGQQIGTVPGTLELAAGGIGAETRQTMENIRATLERYGSSLDRIVKCTIMLDDMGEWPAMNEVYVTFFPGDRPARSALGADGLALGARVEIDCIATVG